MNKYVSLMIVAWIRNSGSRSTLHMKRVRITSLQRVSHLLTLILEDLKVRKFVECLHTEIVAGALAH